MDIARTLTPTGKRVIGFNETRQEAYLEQVRQGVGRGQAARNVGCDRSAAIRLMQRSEEFRLLVEEAELDACDVVESALFKKCVEGNITAIIFYLLNRHPDRWKDRRVNNTSTSAFDMSPDQIREALSARGLKV